MSSNHGSVSGSLKNSFGNILGTTLGIITVGVALSLYNSSVKKKTREPASSDIEGESKVVDEE